MTKNTKIMVALVALSVLALTPTASAQSEADCPSTVNFGLGTSGNIDDFRTGLMNLDFSEMGAAIDNQKDQTEEYAKRRHSTNCNSIFHRRTARNSHATPQEELAS